MPKKTQTEKRPSLPSLRDFPRYVEADGQLTALHNERNELLDERTQLEQRGALNGEHEAEALSLIRGDDSSVATLEATGRLTGVKNRIRVLDLAIVKQEQVVQAALREATNEACILIAEEHSECCLRVLRALHELTLAVESEQQLRESIRAAGFHRPSESILRGQGLYDQRYAGAPRQGLRSHLRGYFRHQLKRFPEHARKLHKTLQYYLEAR